MQVKTEAIVLSAIRYGEADLIVKLFTQKEGLVSYLVRGVLKSKRGKLKASFFQTFNLLEIDGLHKPNASLKQIKDAKPSQLLKTIHTNILKGSLATFLAEIISQILVDSEPDQDFFSFFKRSIIWLDNNQETALFHQLFLLKTLSFLGCYPDTTNQQFLEFNLEEARFSVNSKIAYVIKGDVLIAFKTLLGIDFDKLKDISVPKATRKQLLDALLLYYNFHVTGYRKPKSLVVLQELFN